MTSGVTVPSPVMYSLIAPVCALAANTGTTGAPSVALRFGVGSYAPRIDRE